MKVPKNISAEKLTESLKKLGYEIIRRENNHITVSASITYVKENEEDNETIIHFLTFPDHSPIKPVTLSAIAGDVAMHHKQKKTAILELLYG